MSNETTFKGRRAVSIENDHLRVTVLPGGGHIAEVYDKATGVNPLWTPPWPSIEPSRFDATRHRDYGDGIDAGLLAGIAGHNLCLDIFGGPSDEEARAGLPVHGEASNVDYDVKEDGQALAARARLPLAGLDLERRLELHGRAVWIRETVHNTGGLDPARHPGAAVPREGPDRVQGVPDALARVRVGVRSGRLPGGRRRFRVAERTADRRGFG
jgi:hypothetical protein